MTKLKLVLYILLFAFVVFMVAGAIFWPEYGPVDATYKYVYMVILLGVFWPLLGYARRKAKP